jgi:hypothetical protein
VHLFKLAVESHDEVLLVCLIRLALHRLSPRLLLLKGQQILLRKQIETNLLLRVLVVALLLDRGGQHLCKDRKLFVLTSFGGHILNVLCGKVTVPNISRELLFDVEHKSHVGRVEC